MSDIRLLTLPDLPRALEIRQKAYPIFEGRTPESQQRSLERLAMQLEQSHLALYGLFRDDEMAGVMKLFDFQMNFMGQTVPVGGLSGVAVDVIDKKKGVARELVEFCQRHYEERGYLFTALYPFRPDFYRQMGYGFGSKMYEYRVDPAGLRVNRSARQHLYHATMAELDELQACYQRLYQRTHGLMAHSRYLFRDFHDHQDNHFLVYRPGTDVEGYLIYRFHKLSDDNFLRQEIHVREMMYEHPAALEAMLAFLQVQADQVEQVRFISQDPALHYRFHDPRDAAQRLFPSVNHQIAAVGVGLMYRLTSVPNLLHSLRDHRFGRGKLTLQLELEDDFMPEYGGTFMIRCEEGQIRAANNGAADVKLRIQMADFSAVLMGCTNLADLHRLGLVTLSDPTWLELVDGLFRLPQPPICVTPF